MYKGTRNYDACGVNESYNLRNSPYQMGDVVTVYKGRKVPIGTTGKVFWRNSYKFGKSRFALITWRIGIKTFEGETFFTSADNMTQDNLKSVEAMGDKAKKEGK